MTVTLSPELIAAYREMRQGTYEPVPASQALAYARSRLKRAALGLAPEDFHYVGRPLYGERSDVVYRADLPMTNGHTLAVLVKYDEDGGFEDYEGTFTNSATYDYYRRGLSTTGPRRLRDFTILTTKEREYRARNDGASSGGTGGYRGDRWEMYYEPQEGCDHLTNARYFHKRGMARHAAWTAGMRMEREIERTDAAEKSYYGVELREMLTGEDVDVAVWDSCWGIAFSDDMSSRDEKNYLAETAYDMMSAELRGLLAPRAALASAR